MSGVAGFMMESNRKIPARGPGRSRQARYVLIPFGCVTDIVRDELIRKVPSMSIMFDDFMPTIVPAVQRQEPQSVDQLQVEQPEARDRHQVEEPRPTEKKNYFYVCLPNGCI